MGTTGRRPFDGNHRVSAQLTARVSAASAAPALGRRELRREPWGRAQCEGPKSTEASSRTFQTKERSLKGRIIPKGPSRGGEQTGCAREVTGFPPTTRVPLGVGQLVGRWDRGEEPQLLEAPPQDGPAPGTATLTSTSNRPQPRPPGQRKPLRTGRSSSWPASCPECF